MLPVGGIARFYELAEIYADEGKMRDKIWNTMYSKECENGADKIGWGVLISLERLEQLNMSLLGHLSGPK